MQLSNDTVEVLKNFATINPNLVIEPGEKVKLKFLSVGPLKSNSMFGLKT